MLNLNHQSHSGAFCWVPTARPHACGYVASSVSKQTPLKGSYA